MTKHIRSFPKNLIRIGCQLYINILDMCVGSYITPNRTHILTICVHKKILLCKKANVDPGYYDSFNIYKCIYITKAWRLIDLVY